MNPIMVLGAALLSLALVAVIALVTASPCLTAGGNSVYSTLQSAIDAAAPGITIVLAPGTYTENIVITKVVRLVPADKTDVFAFRSAPGAQSFGGCMVVGVNSVADPKVEQSSVIIHPTDPSRPAIEIRANDVELRDLAIQGGSIGIAVTQAAHVRLLDNAISKSAQAGIALMGTRESFIEGNTISASGDANISLQDAARNRIVANRVERAPRGIILERSSSNTIQNNRLNDLSVEGISLSASSGNTLSQNEIRKSQRGLLFTNSPGNTLRGNTLDQNLFGLRVWGNQPADFVEDITSDNIVNGRPIVYLVGARDLRLDVTKRPALIALVNSEKVTLEGAAFNTKDEGILLVNVRGSAVRRNLLNGTLLGITLIDSRENEISDNQVRDSAENGIGLLRSHGNKLARNEVSASSKHGIYLSQSASNELTGSALSGNKSSGVFLEAGQKNRVMENQLLGNWVGVFLERADASTISSNLIKDNHFGIYINQSGANEIQGNHLESNQTDSNVALPPQDAPPPKAPSHGNSAPGPPNGGS